MGMNVENISFSYKGGRKILDNISFGVENGNILSLLGPNGTGKTTLLKSISCLIKPECGNVSINGENVFLAPPKKRAALIGYVPQYSNGAFALNVVDTVIMGRAAVSGKIGDIDKDIVFDIIKKLDLEKFAFKYTNEMSGGERQRVFIARALAQEPQILILDEPTSSLDLKNQLITLEYISALVKEKNIGVIMAVHDLNLTAMYSDKILMLKDSHIFGLGTPEEILTEDNIKNVYGVNTHVENDNGINVKLLRL